MNETRSQSGLTEVSVARIAPPSEAVFVEDWVRPRRPVVLVGVLQDLPASRWSLDEIRQRFGEAIVPVARTRDGRVAVDPRRGVVRDSQPLHQYLDQLGCSNAGGYMTAVGEELPPELTDALPPPRYCAGAPWCVRKLWISSAGTVTGLHRDLANNLHGQLQGKKRFLLISPDESAGVYPASVLSSIPNGSRVDLEKADFHAFPLLRGVHVHVAELTPGDALFIPRFWWHQVRSLEVSVSVNWFFASGVHAGIVRAADLAKRIAGFSR